MQKLNNSRTNCNSQDRRDKKNRKKLRERWRDEVQYNENKKYGQGMARDSEEWRKILL
jgi:hypothetical protein